VPTTVHRKSPPICPPCLCGVHRAPGTTTKPAPEIRGYRSTTVDARTSHGARTESFGVGNVYNIRRVCLLLACCDVCVCVCGRRLTRSWLTSLLFAPACLSARRAPHKKHTKYMPGMSSPTAVGSSEGGEEMRSDITPDAMEGITGGLSAPLTDRTRRQGTGDLL
jgi:hypothetical protein